MSDTLRLTFNPYTYARVAVMKSRLLQQADYQKLLKMGYHEILRFLQENNYQSVVEKYLSRYSHPVQLEIALNENLLNTVAKLYRISDETMKKIIMAYMLRYELHNIKTIVRSKFSKISPTQAEELFFPSFHHFKKEFIQELLQAREVEELLKALPFFNKKELKMADLFSVEHALDKYYVETLYEFTCRLKGSGKQLAEFLQQEIEITNIKTILALYQHPHEIAKNLVHPSPLVLRIAQKKSLPEIVTILHKYHRTKLTGKEDDLLEKLDIDLEVTLLRRELSLLRENMLNPNYIIGYLLAKEIETKNLKVLLKGKILQVHEAYLENLMVIAK